MAMATGFDSFNRSALGAFVRSPLAARGDLLRTIAVDATGMNWAYDVRDAFEGVPQTGTGGSALTDYACDSGGCSSDPSGTTNVEHGYLDFYEVDLTDDSYTVTPRYFTPRKNWYLWTAPSPPGSCWGTLVPTTDQGYGTGLVVPATQDRALYVSAGGQFLSAANRNYGAPPCAVAWGSTGEPPSDIVYSPTNSTTSHLHLWKRADADSPWVQYSEPFLPPSGYTGLIIDQDNGLVWGRKSTTQISHWALESDWSTATKTDITIPAGTISGHSHWGKWHVVNGSTGDVYAYFDGALVSSFGSPHNPSTWDWYDMAFGWVVVTYFGTPDEYQFWKLEEDGTLSYHSTLAADRGTARMVGPRHAVAGTYYRLRLNATDTWVDDGEQAHIKDLSDAGYVWSDTMHGWIWLENAGLSPKGYLAQVY